MRNSPHSKTPPPGMHAIPGITVGVAPKPDSNGKLKPAPAARPGPDDIIFDMDS